MGRTGRNQEQQKSLQENADSTRLAVEAGWNRHSSGTGMLIREQAEQIQGPFFPRLPACLSACPEGELQSLGGEQAAGGAENLKELTYFYIYFEKSFCYVYNF